MGAGQERQAEHEAGNADVGRDEDIEAPDLPLEKRLLARRTMCGRTELNELVSELGEPDVGLATAARDVAPRQRRYGDHFWFRRRERGECVLIAAEPRSREAIIENAVEPDEHEEDADCGRKDADKLCDNTKIALDEKRCQDEASAGEQGEKNRRQDEDEVGIAAAAAPSCHSVIFRYRQPPGIVKPRRE